MTDAPSMMILATPMAMVARAAEAGNLELVRELLTLKREHEADEARKAFNSALAAACGELPDIAKGKLVDFQGRGGRVRYKHATLASILNQVRPVLAKHQLFVSFDIEEPDGLLRIGCRIRHDGGFERVTWLSGPRDESGQKNAIQAKGSAVTYLERYTLCAALGIAASDDDDGQASAPSAGTRQEPKAEQADTTISAADVVAIRELCAGLVDTRAIAKICHYAQVEALEDITTAQLPEIAAWLRKKKQAEVAAAEAAERELEEELERTVEDEIADEGVSHE